MYPDGVPPEVIEATAGKLGAELPQCRNLTAEARWRVPRRRRGPPPPGPRLLRHLIPTHAPYRQAAGRSLAEIAADLTMQAHKTRREKTMEQDPGQAGPQPGPASVNRGSTFNEVEETADFDFHRRHFPLLDTAFLLPSAYSGRQTDLYQSQDY